MINEFVILYCVTALLFFGLSALTKLKYIWISIPLNVAFLIVLLFSYIQFIGTAVPFQLDIPFWKYQTFTEKTIVNVQTYTIKDDLIHMIVNDEHGSYRYVTFKNTPEFLASLETAAEKAFAAHTTLQMFLMSDTKYKDGSEGNFKEPDDTQKNMNLGKTVYDSGVETHAIDGKGANTPDGGVYQQYTAPNKAH